MDIRRPSPVCSTSSCDPYGGWRAGGGGGGTSYNGPERDLFRLQVYDRVGKSKTFWFYDIHIFKRDSALTAVKSYRNTK